MPQQQYAVLCPDENPHTEQQEWAQSFWNKPDANEQAAETDHQRPVFQMVGQDGGPARAAAFMRARDPAADPLNALARADRLTRCGAALAADVPVSDLDPAARDRWTAEQWARADAAGLIRFEPPPADEVETPFGSQLTPLIQLGERSVWWCEREGRWLTSFPPDDDVWGGWVSH